MDKPTTYFTFTGFRCLRNIKRQTDDLYLVHCGYQECSADYTYNHNIPNEYHLHFVLNGSGTLIIKGITYEIKKDDIFLIPKDIPIDYKADHNDPWKYVWVTFDGTKAETYLRCAGFSESKYVITSSIPTLYYQPIVKKILDSNTLTIANEIKRVGFLYEIISMLIDAQTINNKDINHCDYSSKTYVEHALQFISSNYNHITVNDIVTYIGINRSYLSSIFKKELGVSPQEYLICFRLKKAAALLTKTTLSIKEISSTIGYQNPYNFSKMFKKFYEITPTNYRLQQVSKDY